VHRLAFASAVLALLGGVLPVRADLAPAVRSRLLGQPRVAAEVVGVLARQERVRVVVAFATPPASGGAAAGEERRLRIAATGDRILRAVGETDFRVRRRFASVRALAGDVTSEGLERLLERREVLRIDLDAPGTGSLAQSLPVTNLDDVKGGGFTGAGVTVAVIDSGVDGDHPDFTGALVAEACFCSGGGGCCPGGAATQTGAGAAEDDNGHGTNVTGIVASRGTVAAAGGAPGASIVAVKVLDATNSFCCASDVVAGMDWVLQNHPETRVVNLSLGTAALFAGACDTATSFTIAFADAVAALRTNGTLTVVSSGNQASATEMAAPACIADAVSVGATWDAGFPSQTVLGCTDATVVVDRPTCFANSNDTTDLFAPGAYITASGLGGGTSTFAGTSQAAPTVAACAADLVQANGTLTPAQLAGALAASPVTVVDPKNGLSFPRLDCAASLQTVTLPGCTRAPTFESLTCRLDDFGDRLDASAIELGPLHDKLAASTLAARTKLAAAEGFVADGNAKGARKAIRVVKKKSCAAARKLASKKAVRLVSDATRLPLLALAEEACADVVTLRDGL